MQTLSTRKMVQFILLSDNIDLGKKALPDIKTTLRSNKWDQ